MLAVTLLHVVHTIILCHVPQHMRGSFGHDRQMRLRHVCTQLVTPAMFVLGKRIVRRTKGGACRCDPSLGCVWQVNSQKDNGGCLLCRDRVHMLLAAFSCLYEKLREAGEAQRCQLAQTAVSLFAQKFQALLLGSDTAGQPASWQQVSLDYTAPPLPSSSPSSLPLAIR